ARTERTGTTGAVIVRTGLKAPRKASIAVNHSRREVMNVRSRSFVRLKTEKTFGALPSRKQLILSSTMPRCAACGKRHSTNTNSYSADSTSLRTRKVCTTFRNSTSKPYGDGDPRGSTRIMLRKLLRRIFGRLCGSALCRDG